MVDQQKPAMRQIPTVAQVDQAIRGTTNNFEPLVSALIVRSFNVEHQWQSLYPK